MDNQQLRAELKELHDRIEASMHRDPLDRDALSHIMTDLVLLAEGKEDDISMSDSLKAQIEEKATDFESRHPKTAAIMREVADVLARLGF